MKKTIEQQKQDSNINTGCILFVLMLVIIFAATDKSGEPTANYILVGAMVSFLVALTILIRNNVVLRKETQTIQQTA